MFDSLKAETLNAKPKLKSKNAENEKLNIKKGNY